MSVATPPILTQAHRFTSERYRLLIDSGAFLEDDRVELLNGIITDMSPIGTRHVGAVNGLLEHFSQLPQNKRATLSVQSPFILDNWSEPQPDLWLAPYRKDRYSSGLPRASDLMLVIEVADTTVETDTRVKIPLYASANISEAWLVNVNNKTVTIYRKPSQGQYTETQVFTRPTDQLAPLAFPDCQLTLATLFPT